jgi:hypothetical protein
MDADLPLLDHDRIARAAEGMISNHGNDALAEAEKRTQTMRSAGCDAAAGNWERVCGIIQGRIGGYALVGSTVAPKLSQPEMPGRATLKASFFETL